MKLAALVNCFCENQFFENLKLSNFLKSVESYFETGDYENSIPSSFDKFIVAVNLRKVEVAECKLAEFLSVVLYLELQAKMVLNDPKNYNFFKKLWDRLPEFLNNPSWPPDLPVFQKAIFKISKIKNQLSKTVYEDEKLLEKYYQFVYSRPPVSDDFWHEGLFDFLDAVDFLNLDATPSGGTLLAFLRYGKRTGVLSFAKEDVVDRDLDFLVFVQNESNWSSVVLKISDYLRTVKKWDFCFSKFGKNKNFKNILYCLKISKFHGVLLLDISSVFPGELKFFNLNGRCRALERTVRCPRNATRFFKK